MCRNWISTKIRDCFRHLSSNILYYSFKITWRNPCCVAAVPQMVGHIQHLGELIWNAGCAIDTSSTEIIYFLYLFVVHFIKHLKLILSSLVSQKVRWNFVSWDYLKVYYIIRSLFYSLELVVAVLAHNSYVK